MIIIYAINVGKCAFSYKERTIMTRKGSKKKGICALSAYFFAFCCAEIVFFTSTFCGAEGCSLLRG